MEFGQPGHYGQYMGKDYVKTKYGWNIRHCRPATHEDHSAEICHCCECTINGTYGAFYCGRLKSAGYLMNLERFYWRHYGSQAIR